MPKIAVVIPALNEEKSIGKVLDSIPKNLLSHYEWQIVVCDNGSTDATAQIAKEHGATVVYEKERGYGAACLKALSVVHPKTDIVVFLDADFSDHPQEMVKLIQEIEGGMDLVIGSRVLGQREKGALTLPQILGNFLATRLIWLFWKFHYTDLGPMRAIRYESLKKLNMQERNFGWTVEMQIKACEQNLRIKEVAVSYRKRIGKSKISGTVKGTILAGYTILKVIFCRFLGLSRK